MRPIRINGKAVGVSINSAYKHLNSYTDEQVEQFIERCRDDPRDWHVAFRHKSLNAARQKVHRLKHDLRWSGLPLKYRAIRPPSGILDTTLKDVGGYVVAQYVPLRDRAPMEMRHYVDVGALSPRKLDELLVAIETSGVFQVPPECYSNGIGYDLSGGEVVGVMETVVDEDGDVGEQPMYRPTGEDDIAPITEDPIKDPTYQEDETAFLMSSEVNAERLSDSLAAVRRGEYQERELIEVPDEATDSEEEVNFDDLF